MRGRERERGRRRQWGPTEDFREGHGVTGFQLHKSLSDLAGQRQETLIFQERRSNGWDQGRGGRGGQRGWLVVPAMTSAPKPCAQPWSRADTGLAKGLVDTLM